LTPLRDDDLEFEFEAPDVAGGAGCCDDCFAVVVMASDTRGAAEDDAEAAEAAAGF
jgi:hypothetical protein